MAREEQRHAYYDEILQGKSYIDNRLAIQTAVADYLAHAFFGKDTKRVVYTNPEYAFRRRVETLAKGIDNQVIISSLDLPFCSFYLDGAPKIIKTAAASEWNGYYDEELDQRIHFYNTLQGCTVQFFFERSDDATVAFEIAQTESLAGYPIRYSQDIIWRNKTLQLPIWITVKEVKAGNESFDESAWLNQAHMFAVRLKLEIETARVHIHRGLNAVQLPFKWRATGNPDTWKDESSNIEYYTQKCVLIWAQSFMGIDITEPEIPTKEAEELTSMITDMPLKEVDPQTLKVVQKYVPNNAIVEMVEGYFQSPTEIKFNVLRYVPEKTTIDEHGEVTAWFDMVVKPASYQYWDRVEVYIPSRQKGSITINNCKETYVQIDGLHPNSIYTVYFIAHDINGNFNTIPIEFTTPVWKNETLPVVDSGDPNDLNNIEKKEPGEPTRIKGRGLIGLDF